MLRTLRWCILFLLITAAARAQGLPGLGGLAVGGPIAPVSARALLDADLKPGGDANLIVEIKIDRRYHIQSADAPKGFKATQLTATAPHGVTLGEVRYPPSIQAPTPAGYPGPATIPVYEGTVYLQLPVHAEADADLSDLKLSLTTQACNATSCDPPQTTTLTVTLNTPPKPQNAPLIAAAAKQTYVTVATPPAALPPTPVPPTAITDIDSSNKIPLFSPERQLALIAERPYTPANATTYPVWAIVLLALAGGIILNIMPCVLPVIPLKVLSLVQQAHGDRRTGILHSLAFSAGVIVLFVALAIVLKSLGLFYGQQFQSPGFLIAMILFVVALALSMLGVWTINPPQALYAVDAKLAEAAARGTTSTGDAPLNPLAYATPAAHRSAMLGAFANGLMATLLATPCSAPFLGGVLAWALVQPTWLAALTLGLVGVGMSLPYIILAAFPALLSKVPRTGRWSELLKQGLGIVMLGVAVYLVQLVPQVQLWPWVMLGAVVVALVCWGWGQIPTAAMAARRVWTIRIACLFVGALLGLTVYSFGAKARGVSFAQQAEGNWQPFNIALLDAALAEGRPVVVDWTADWCINCRVLDAAVLSKHSVQSAFASQNALLLRADLSEDNPPATALNRKLGGEAIPVLAIFSPASPYRPVVLRDSYSPSRVIEEVGRAK